MRHLLFAALAAAPAIAAAGWTLETVQDKATWQNVTVLHQASTGTISDEYGMKEVNPRLEFRCVPMSGDGVGVRIDWQRFISSFNTEVQFAADEREPLTVSMGVDRSNKITSTRDGADDEKLVNYLDGAATLEITVTPYSEVPVSVQYPLDDFAAQLAALREACGG